jgi:hypothetical protein
VDGGGFGESGGEAPAIFAAHRPGAGPSEEVQQNQARNYLILTKI